MTVNEVNKYWSVRKVRNVIYFDTETLSINPYQQDVGFDNPYGLEPKLLTTQILTNNELTIEKEWEIGERQLINNLLVRFNKWADSFKGRKYMPMVTYHGIFDYLYILGRMDILGFSQSDKSLMSSLFASMKHIDLMQYDLGYLVSLNGICDKYHIGQNCEFNGRDIKELYSKKKYDSIIMHGIDDVRRLFRLNTETPLGDRFFTDGIGVLNAKRI